MSEKSPGPDFLKEKYGNLHASEEVNSAAQRTKRITGEKVSQSPKERIQNYLDRFKEITERKDPIDKERGVSALKKVFYDKFVIKSEEIPESAFLLEKRIAREQGYGDVEITDEFRERKTEQIINNQQNSLDKWIDYLSLDDAQYPDWAKYWTFRSVLEMGKFEKEKDEETGKETACFKKRTKDTVSSFSPLNPRALAMTIGTIRSKLDERYKPKEERQPIANISKKLDDKAFQQLLSTENFSKIYAQFLIEMPEYSTEGLRETRGKWVTYPQGSDATPLVKSLEGHPLEWCTADFDTAQDQLRGGDFHVYYSINDSGDPIIPRLAIRMQGNHIAENPRGIAPDQNLDPYIGDVLEEKLQEFGKEGEAYKKRAEDMKRLTEIDTKTQKGEVLSKEELRFLYEMDSKIEGFGYQRDPRIKEITNSRDFIKDMEVIFETKNHNEIANLLIKAGEGGYVADNLEKFQGLDQGTANLLIKDGLGGFVAYNFEKFQGLNHNEIANLLIKAGEGYSVARNLEKFQGLDHNEIANILIKNRLGGSVACNLEKFQGLDHNKVANLLIKAGEGRPVAYNFEKFQGLDQETLDKISRYR